MTNICSKMLCHGPLQLGGWNDMDLTIHKSLVTYVLQLIFNHKWESQNQNCVVLKCSTQKIWPSIWTFCFNDCYKPLYIFMCYMDLQNLNYTSRVTLKTINFPS